MNGDLASVRELPESPETPALNALTSLRRAFVIHYVLGDDDVRGIAYKAYIAAGGGVTSIASASAAASAVMREDVVKKAINELRVELEREARGKMKSWAGMALKAQMILDRALDTMANPEVALASKTEVYLDAEKMAVIRETLERALGKSVTKIENDIGERLESTISRLAAQRKNKEIPHSGIPLLRQIAEQ